MSEKTFGQRYVENFRKSNRSQSVGQRFIANREARLAREAEEAKRKRNQEMISSRLGTSAVRNPNLMGNIGNSQVHSWDTKKSTYAMTPETIRKNSMENASGTPAAQKVLTPDRVTMGKVADLNKSKKTDKEILTEKLEKGSDKEWNDNIGGFYTKANGAKSYEQLLSELNEEMNKSKSRTVPAPGGQIVFGKDREDAVSDEYEKTYQLYVKYLDELAARDDVLTLPDPFEVRSNDEMTMSGIKPKDVYSPSTINGYEKMSDGTMTDNEKQVYHFLYQTNGKEAADKYLEELRIDDRLGEKYAEIWDDTGVAGKYTGLGIMGLGNAVEDMNGALDSLEGKDTHNISGKAAPYILEDLDGIGPKIGGRSIARVGGDMVFNITNMAPSMMIGAAGGIAAGGTAAATNFGQILGSSVMGVQSYGGAYEEARGEGKDQGESMAYGALVGASEAALSYLLSGISAYGGKVTGNVVKNAVDKIDNVLLKVVAEGTIKNAGEFTEEYLQEILEPVFRNICFDENNEIKVFSEEALYAGVLGALTAGLMEGPATVAGGISTVNNGRTINNYGADINGTSFVDVLKRFGEEQERGSLLYNLSQEEKLTDGQMGILYDAYEQAYPKAAEHYLSAARVEKTLQKYNARTEKRAARMLKKGSQTKSSGTDTNVANVEEMKSRVGSYGNEALSEAVVKNYREEFNNSEYEGFMAKYYQTGLDGISRAQLGSMLHRDPRTKSYGVDAAEEAYNAGVKELDMRHSEAQQKVVKSIAKNLGVNVEIYTADDGSNAYLDENGKIHVNMTSENPLVVAFGHELVHDIRRTNEETYKALRDIAVSQMNLFDKEGYEARFNQLKKLYEKNGKPDEDIEEEMVANAFSDFLMDESVAEKIIRQDMNFAQKILDTIKKLIRQIKKELKGYQYNSFEARALRSNLETLEEAKSLYVKGLNEVRESRKSGEVKAAEDIKADYKKSEDRGLYEFAKDTVDGKTSKKDFYTISEKISSRLAVDIKRLLDLDVRDYGNEISQGQIKHIESRHGKNGEADQSMKDLHDVARMKFVIENYDKIWIGKGRTSYRNSDGTFAKTIMLQKKIDEGYYYVAEAVPDSRAKKLRVVSTFINKKDTSPEVVMPESLPLHVRNDAQSDVSTNSITGAEGKSKRKNSFAGADALTADNDARIRAYWMEQEGKKEKEIFQETGWFRGADGKWRFEIDDSEAKVYRHGDAELLKKDIYREYERLYENVFNGLATDEDLERIRIITPDVENLQRLKKIKTISDYLEHPTLFKAYPLIADIPVTISELEAGVKGRCDSLDGIIINKDLTSEYTEKVLKKTLLHELQHVIQHYERFASGTWPGAWGRIEIKENQQKFDKAMKEKKEAFDGGTEEFKDLVRKLNRLQLDEDFGEEYDRIENKLYEEYGERYSQYDNAMFEVRLYAKSERLSDFQKYEMTAGEIEARDVANRSELSKIERKEKFPTRETEHGVIFVENTENPFEYRERRYSMKENQWLNEEGIFGNSGNALSRLKIFERNWKKRDGVKTETGEHVFDAGNCLVYTKNNKSNTIHRVVEIILKNDEDGILDYHQRIKEAIYDYERDSKGAERESYCEAQSLFFSDNYGRPVKIRIYERDSDSNAANGRKAERRVFETTAGDYRGKSDGSGTDSEGKGNSRKHSLKESGSAYLEEEHIAESIEKIEVGLGITGGEMPTEKEVHKMAQKIIERYESSYDVDKLAWDISTALTEMETASAKEIVENLSAAIKPALMESARMDYTLRNNYQEMLDFFSGEGIALTEEEKSEWEQAEGKSFESIRKTNMGRLLLKENGTSLSSVWEELCTSYPEFFDREAEGAERIMQVLDAIDAVQPRLKSEVGYDLNKTATDRAIRVLADYFDLGSVKKEYGEAVKGVSGEIKAEVNKYRYNSGQNFNRSMRTIRQRALRVGEVYAENEELQKQIREGMAAVRVNERTKMREVVERRKHRDAVRRNAKTLTNWMENPTTTRHVPDGLRGAVVELLASIDYLSNRADLESKESIGWTERMRKLEVMLNEYTKNGANDFDALGDIDPNLPEKIEAIAGKYEGKKMKLSDMTTEELRELSEIVNGVRKGVTESNDLRANKLAEKVNTLGDMTVSELKEKKEGNATGIKKMADFDLLDPIRVFERMGKAAKSIFDELQEGFNKRTKLLEEAMEYAKPVLKGVDIEKLEKNMTTIKLGDKYVRLSKAHIMSLYLYGKRKESRFHLEKGGFKVEEMKGARLDGKKYGKDIKQSEYYRISEAQISMLANTYLTEEERGIADRLQHFMATNCARWGNEVSQILYEYDKYLDEDYIPMFVDDSANKTNNRTVSETSLNRVANYGFTKKLQNKAKKPLVIHSLFDVFTRHVVEMANHNAYTVPVNDALKWINYQTVEAVNEGGIYAEDPELDHDGVKHQLERVYGRAAQKYITDLIKDINGESVNMGTDMGIGKLISNFKVASVAANLRVVVQQPTAIMRVMDIIDPKYVLQAGRKDGVSGGEKARKYCCLAKWKSWGFFDTGLNTGLKNVLTGQGSMKEKIQEKALWAAGKADDVTWGIIWNICEAEQKDKTGLSGEELYKKTAERMTEVCAKTQVVDSVLTKSAALRSKNQLVKAEMTFQSEANKSMNMLLDTVYAVRSRDKNGYKKVARGVGVFLANALVNAAAQSLIDAGRDDDETKKWLEKYAESFMDNAKDNAGVWNMIPYVKDVVSIASGYGADRNELVALNNLVLGGQKIEKWMNDKEYREEHSIYQTFYTFAQGVSQLLGIPASAVIREITVHINLISRAVSGENLIQTKSYTYTDKYTRIVQAMEKGDTETVNELKKWLREHGRDENAIQRGIENARKNLEEN